MYKAISCDFYDEIINTITLQQHVRLTYKEGEQTLVTDGEIIDVFTKNKEEFCAINGLEIRLDRVVKVEVMH